MKKGEMGVGTLIIFIAMLLVAAVAAGVLLQTAGSLQETSLSTGSQAEAQIATHAETIEVSASDGRNGNLTDFMQLIKLSPGSEPIKLSQVIFTFNTKDNTGTLKYKGPDSICENSNSDGYNTWNEEEIGLIDETANSITLAEDLDDDGLDDYLYIKTTTNLTYVFNLSSAGTVLVNGGQNINDSSSSCVDITGTGTITNGTETFGYITITGSSCTNDTIDDNVNFLVTPYKLNEGYFSAVYEQQSTNWIDGTLQRGDMIKICYEAPREVQEDEEIRLNFIPKIGSSTLTQFATPDVISTERVYLYP